MANDEQHPADAAWTDEPLTGEPSIPDASTDARSTDRLSSDDPACDDPAGDEYGVADADEPLDSDAPDEDAAPTWRRFDLRTDAEAGLEAAAEAITAGQCIVLPTDTVYGIGANPFSSEAVQGLLDAKHRGRDMPPPVLIAEPAMLEALGSDVEAYARRLAEEHWPGALTLIVTMQPSLRVDLGETRGTIALRVPDHDLARDLLRRTGPLAVSSANVSGRPASTNIDDAIEQLGDSVAVYLDAGPTPGETASTIIDFVSESFGRIVRQGALSLEEIREVDPFVEEFRAPEASTGAHAAGTTPDAAAGDTRLADVQTTETRSGDTHPGGNQPAETQPTETHAATEPAPDAPAPHAEATAEPSGEDAGTGR